MVKDLFEFLLSRWLLTSDFEFGNLQFLVLLAISCLVNYWGWSKITAFGSLSFLLWTLTEQVVLLFFDLVLIENKQSLLNLRIRFLSQMCWIRFRIVVNPVWCMLKITWGSSWLWRIQRHFCIFILIRFLSWWSKIHSHKFNFFFSLHNFQSFFLWDPSRRHGYVLNWSNFDLGRTQRGFERTHGEWFPRWTLLQRFVLVTLNVILLYRWSLCQSLASGFLFEFPEMSALLFLLLA